MVFYKISDGKIFKRLLWHPPHASLKLNKTLMKSVVIMGDTGYYYFGDLRLVIWDILKLFDTLEFLLIQLEI